MLGSTNPSDSEDFGFSGADWHGDSCAGSCSVSVNNDNLSPSLHVAAYTSRDDILGGDMTSMGDSDSSCKLSWDSDAYDSEAQQIRVNDTEREYMRRQM